MITKQDTLRHQPQEGEPFWQESFFLCWADVRNRCAFHCHISLSPHNQKAHLWAWLIVDGKEVARSKEQSLTIPNSDFDDISLDVAQFIAGKALGELCCKANFSNATVDVSYKAFSDPVEPDFNAGELSLGSRHYESMGAIEGLVVYDGNEYAIQGVGWHDHSWGIRHFSSNPAGRWIFAAFDEKLAFSVFSLATPEGGSVAIGYVLDDGEIYPIDSVEAGVTVSDDGISPVSASSTIWTKNGKGYKLKAKILGTALVGGVGWAEDSAYLAMDGLAEFECAGRIGGGLIEVANFREITRQQKEKLGIPF